MPLVHGYTSYSVLRPICTRNYLDVGWVMSAAPQAGPQEALTPSHFLALCPNVSQNNNSSK